MTDTPAAGHLVDSSDRGNSVPPELAALDAAMAATGHMWGDVRTVHRARILEVALEAAQPVLAAAERDRIRRLADEKRARYADEVSGTGLPMHWRLFGDLLDGDADG